MSYPRAAAAGATRECPHCKETILASARVCPACGHHLRFEAGAATSADSAVTPTRSALRVEASLAPPADADTCEYSVVVVVRNARGDEISRKVVGVGAIAGSDTRSVSVSVDVTPLSKIKRY